MKASAFVARTGVPVALAASAAPVCIGNCTIGTDLRVGSNGRGDGSFTHSGGEALDVPREEFVGAFGTDTGTALVGGSGTRLSVGGVSASQFFVGTDRGTGSLDIRLGANVTIDAFDNRSGFGDALAYIGTGGIGTVTVCSGGGLFVQDRRAFGAEDGIQISRPPPRGAVC